MVFKFSADKVFTSDGKFSDDAVIITNEKGKILGIDSCDAHEAVSIQKLKGILCPGFINTHCHLELSHMKNPMNHHSPLFCQRHIGGIFGMFNKVGEYGAVIRQKVLQQKKVLQGTGLQRITFKAAVAIGHFLAKLLIGFGKVGQTKGFEFFLGLKGIFK